MESGSFAHCDVRQTCKETGLDFDVVWEMVGLKDAVDFEDQDSN